MARGQPLDFDSVSRAAAPQADDGSMEHTGREPARAPARQSARPYVAPEPHLRYELLPEEIPEGMEAQWVAISVKGAPIPSLSRFYRGGWVPAQAGQFARLSGYGTEYPQQLIEAGLVKNVGASDPVLDDDKSQILMLRPKEIGQKATRRRTQEARDLVATQMERLSLNSRRTIGDRTQFQRQFANPDHTPDIASAQEI